MDVLHYIIIISVVVLIVFVFFRKYISGLFYDYVVDAGLSFADNFVAGAGLMGLDIGDWIAAVIIFIKERRISGVFVAGFVAWEATNFIPFSMIPVVGEGLEIVCNLFPSVTLSRFLFSKYGKAKRKKHKIEEKLDLTDSKEEYAEILDSIQNMIDSQNPVGAIEKEEEVDREVSESLIAYVNGLRDNTIEIIQELVHEDLRAPDELMELLQEGINKSEEYLQKSKEALDADDFKEAVSFADDAKNVIISAAENFQDNLSQLNE